MSEEKTRFFDSPSQWLGERNTGETLAIGAGLGIAGAVALNEAAHGGLLGGRARSYAQDRCARRLDVAAKRGTLSAHAAARTLAAGASTLEAMDKNSAFAELVVAAADDKVQKELAWMSGVTAPVQASSRPATKADDGARLLRWEGANAVVEVNGVELRLNQSQSQSLFGNPPQQANA